MYIRLPYEIINKSLCIYWTMRNDRPDYHCSSVVKEKHLTNNKEGSGFKFKLQNSNYSITKKYSK